MEKIEKLQFIQKKINVCERQIAQEMPTYYKLTGSISEWEGLIKKWKKQLRFWKERFKKTAKELYELY